MNFLNRILCFAALSGSAMAIGQNELKDGYYIDKGNIRHVGAFASFELESINDNNTQVTFRPQGAGQTYQVSAEDIIEIGIANDVKLKKYTVDLDDSNYINVGNASKYAEFITVTTFLNVIVEGKASLLAFESRFGDKYFYQIGTDNPQQLIYKKFRLKQNVAPQENVEFRQQLQEKLSCESDPFSKFSALEYKKPVLIEIVRNYNQCMGGETVGYENIKRNKVTFMYGAYGGLYFSKAKVKGDKSVSDTETTYSAGMDFEFLSPARQWGYFAKIELEKSAVNVDRVERYSVSDVYIKDSYKFNSLTLDAMVGARFHFNRAAANHLFIDGAVGVNFPFSGDIEVDRSFITDSEGPVTNTTIFDPQTNVFGNFGLGYSFNRKFSVSGRIESPKVILLQGDNNVSYLRYGINVGYTF